MGHPRQPHPSQRSTWGSKFPKPRRLLNNDADATRRDRDDAPSSQENILLQGEILKTTEVEVRESTPKGQNSRRPQNDAFIDDAF